jgi:hypothetical protein
LPKEKEETVKITEEQETVEKIDRYGREGRLGCPLPDKHSNVQ